MEIKQKVLFGSFLVGSDCELIKHKIPKNYVLLNNEVE